ncbi:MULTISPECIES: hypothetical protein [unclassified Paenibacillus]|uniref:hypothetical protein n=1 Tax=unclassified Paenibacillus TaxID=185978 RepID=UPI0003E27C1F|nr:MULTISPECIES: hypothetical protein [unclassified Paenibacillus]ETT30104.1 hypothetical protein C162_33845 [Paenibacillus sp. FSL R7-269]OMF94250.1 hypothetical protein BK147_17065 [Paenibacillus sp. FSL R7-0337]
MDIRSVKNVAPNRNLLKRIVAVLFSLTVIVVSYIVITNASQDARDTVEVLRLTEKGGLPAFTVLTEKQVETYNIIRTEYTSDMVLADKLPEVLGKFTKYYIRDNSVLYEDQLLDEKPVKNEWLYKLGEKQEVLTLPYNFLEAGGDILMPGDRVRIRVSYNVEEAAASGAGGNPNAVFNPSQSSVTKTEILFDSIVIKDMLNANSHSIYEVYKEVLKLSEDKRQEVMRSDDFLKSIQPKALLLEGSGEEINKYAKYKSLDSKSFLITMLSRSGSTVIMDELPTLQNEVESWIEKK